MQMEKIRMDKKTVHMEKEVEEVAHMEMEMDPDTWNRWNVQ